MLFVYAAHVEKGNSVRAETGSFSLTDREKYTHESRREMLSIVFANLTHVSISLPRFTSQCGYFSDA